MAIHPVTNMPQAATDLVRTLSRESMPSRDKVIKLDLEPVSFDLAAIPLDDVLEFRTEHGNAHRAYMRDLRNFMAELAEIDNLVNEKMCYCNADGRSLTRPTTSNDLPNGHSART